MVVAREGKAGRRTRKPDPDAEARKAHYLQSKQTAKDIKSGTTVKAIGSTGTASNKTLTTGTKTTQSQHQGLVKARVLVANQLLNLVRVQQPVASQLHVLVRVHL